MSARMCLILAGLVILPGIFSCGKHGTQPTQPIQTTPLFSSSQIQTIESEVATLRGLSFKRSPNIGYISSTAYAASVASQVQSQISDFQDTGLTSELYQLGLLSSPDSSVRSITAAFEGGFPAAFYKDGTDSLYILTGISSDSLQLSFTVAHELTHALQDQYEFLSIQPYPPLSLSQSDASIALRSLVEGDAESMEALFAYTYGFNEANPHQDMLNWASAMRDSFLTYRFGFETPAYFSGQSNAPYLAGTYFVSTKVGSPHDWSVVNALYTQNTLPASTAEIIRLSHFSPTAINFAAIQKLMLDSLPGVGFIDDDNLGAITLMSMIAENPQTLSTTDISDSGHAQNAFGWTGDHMAYMHRHGQKSGTLVWALTFSDATNAGLLYSYLTRKTRKSAQSGAAFVAGTPYSDSRGYQRVDFTAGSVKSRIACWKGNVWWIDNGGTLIGKLDTLVQNQLMTASSSKEIAMAPIPGASINGTVKNHVMETILGRIGKKSRNR